MYLKFTVTLSIAIQLFDVCPTSLHPFFSGLAWAIVPLRIKVHDAEANVSWRVFSGVCAIPALVTAILVTFFPESPKFLLSTKGDREALAVLRRIYKVNHRKETRPYPVSSK